MSVYTPQQIGQSLIGQGQIGQSQIGQGQQLLGIQGPGLGQQLPLLVTELSLRCAGTAVNAMVEQLRIDPQILMGIQTQGQIPPQAWSSVLTECARRIAPIVHMTLAQIISQGQGQIGEIPGQIGQMPGQQIQGQMGPLQGQGQQIQGQMGQYGQLQGLQGSGMYGQPQYGQLPGM
ncbi:hypothetical protein ABZX75_34130 [Streptomyces sp. NPDC003038]|uniref:hypothetical protein n=1 Tax=unclassified Streptomyces TaxID=2593676 RepID=UPI0033B007C0